MAESVTEFFKDQNVFITGGTGFLGSVLIEKLLRSCPNIGKIYLLIREKKEANINERLEKLVNMPLFDRVKTENPMSLKKLVPLHGDTMELNLGLSESDYQMLEENVSIVFNCAANVKFNESLKRAIIMNTRSTREIMLLSRKMHKLKVFVHVSTCYCHCDKKVVEEKMYPAPVDWKQFINVAETIDEYTLDILTTKVTGKLPNTYVFTKALAEHVVNDLGQNLPVVIIRPSIVVSSVSEPIPGWSHSLNGIVGLFVGGGKGVLRTMITKVSSESVFDTVPVDYTIKAMCLAAWEKGISQKLEEPDVYNVSAPEQLICSIKYLLNIATECIYKMPVEGMLWVPRVYIVESLFLYKLNAILTQVLPALILDYILTLRGQKPMLTNIQRKIHVAVITLSYFTLNSWIFKNDKTKLLGSKVSNNDDFNIELEGFDIKKHMYNSHVSACQYILKITPGTASSKRTLRRI